MTLAATTLRATGVLGIACVVLAGATLWLVFTEPATVARVAHDGDLTVLFHVITAALADAFRAAVKYL
jgi:membrane protein YqaA with SNARE-associated domain